MEYKLQRVIFEKNEMDLNTNDILNLTNEDYKNVMESKKVKISLTEKFGNYNGENLAKEFSWDKALGKEIW